MNKVQRKWRFVIPVASLTVGCAFWLCGALGFVDPLMPFSLSHLIVFLISISAFRSLYSWFLWWSLVWLAPGWVGEKRVNS